MMSGVPAQLAQATTRTMNNATYSAIPQACNLAAWQQLCQPFTDIARDIAYAMHDCTCDVNIRTTQSEF